jgi:hypothetical protein
MQLRNALVQAHKRLAMRGQGQRVGGQWLELVNRLQKQAQVIGLGLGVVHTHVG